MRGQVCSFFFKWLVTGIATQAVYILDPATGYVLAHQGANGFNCLVERTNYETRLMNMPHYMFCGPNLTSKDFGGGPPPGSYPYLINAGPHAYMILNMGDAEKTRINRESQDLIEDLCAYRSSLCIEGASVKHSSH